MLVFMGQLRCSVALHRVLVGPCVELGTAPGNRWVDHPI